MQAARSGSARRRQRRTVNQRFLLAMTDMGIPADKAELALYETGNVGVEVRHHYLHLMGSSSLLAVECELSWILAPKLFYMYNVFSWS